MKKLNYGLAFLITVGTLFVSCNEEVSITETTDILNNEELVKLGEYHNSSLETIFDDFNWNNSNRKEELISQLQNKEVLLTKYDLTYLESRAHNDFEDNYNSLKERMSLIAFEYIEKTVELSLNIENIEYFNSEVNILQQEARLEISNIIELNAVLVSLETFKSSAHFWSPTNIGGSGIGYAYISNYNSNTKTKQTDWKTVLAADGISAGIGMIGVAIAAMLGPVGWVALVIVAGEAALSSASTLLFI